MQILSESDYEDGDLEEIQRKISDSFQKFLQNDLPKFLQADLKSIQLQAEQTGYQEPPGLKEQTGQG